MEWDEFAAKLAGRPEPQEAWLNGLAYNSAASSAVLLRIATVRDRLDDPHSWLRHRRLPDEAAAALARHPERKVRMAIAENMFTSLELLAVLARDPEWHVRSAAFESPFGDRRRALFDILEREPGDPPPPPPEPDTDGPDAPLPPLTRAEAQALIAAPGEYARAKAAWDERVPQDIALQLADDPADRVRLCLSLREDLTEEQRAAIPYVVHYGYHEVPEWLKELRKDPEAIAEYAESGHVLIRRSVAMAGRLPPATVARLADDEDFFVRLTLAQCCDDAPHELIIEMFAHWHGVRWHDLSYRPNFVREGMAADFADHPNPRLRWAASADPTATPEMIESLSRDPDHRVRPGALSDERLPPARLQEALVDPQTAEFAARNPVLPETVMHALLDCAGVER
ncbi:hypothetical protein [Catenulispora subtropica]|uniref:Leucine rich repeat variant n=1 Tax=Catenulispora subtropica TaxID=450798 RepID=A0ABN2SCV3_9ACTN